MIRRLIPRQRKIQFKHILILLSFAGFLWQTFVVSIQYFAYKTTTTVAFVMPEQVRTQNSVVCARYRDVMDRKRIQKETGINFHANNSIEGLTERLTVEQIFKYTPDPEKVISRCLVRHTNGVVIRNPDCAYHFNVSKFFTQEYICYRFRRKQRDDYPAERVTHSIIFSFMVYEIIMTKEFEESVIVQVNLMRYSFFKSIHY